MQYDTYVSRCYLCIKMIHKIPTRTRYHVGMRRLMAIATLFLIVMTQNPANAQNALGPGMYDQNVPQISYSGTGFTWTTTTDGTGYGGSRITTGATTSTNPLISFNIWGGGFTLYIVSGTTGANANMCIDGNCSSVSWYGVSTAFTTIQVTGLSYGTHVITIQKTSSALTFINLDALYVAPPPLPPTVIPPTPIVVITMIYPTPQPTPTGTQSVWIGNWDDMPNPEITFEITDDPSIQRFDVLDSEGNNRPVSVEYSINAGQIISVILQAGALVLLMVIMIVLARSKS